MCSYLARDGQSRNGQAKRQPKLGKYNFEYYAVALSDNCQTAAAAISTSISGEILSYHSTGVLLAPDCASVDILGSAFSFLENIIQHLSS
jgi:hypothetical protein